MYNMKFYAYFYNYRFILTIKQIIDIQVQQLLFPLELILIYFSLLSILTVK